MSDQQPTTTEAPIDAAIDTAVAEGQHAEAVEGGAQEPNGFDWDAVKGQEVEIDVDGEKMKVPLAELKLGYQRRQAADRRFEEAASMRREVETAIHAFNENPVEGLKRLKATDYFKQNPQALVDLVGEDVFSGFAEETIWQKMQREKRMQENPHEVQAEEYKKKLEEYERKEREAKEKAEKEQLTQQQQVELDRVRTTLEKEITDNLTKSELPATPETIARYARIYRSALAQGYNPAPEDIVAKVQESYMGELQKLVHNLPDDQASKFLGDDFIKKIRQADLSKLKQPTRSVAGLPSGEMPETRKQYIDPDDFFAQRRKERGL